MNDRSANTLSAFERWQLTWGLTWPVLVVNGTYWLLDTLVFQSTSGPALAYALLFACFLQPWIVRRIVRRGVPGLALAVVSTETGEETRRMRYRESLAVAWLLLWRGSLPFLVLGGAQGFVQGLRDGFLAGLEGRQIGPRPSFMMGADGLALLAVWAAIYTAMYYFWVVQAAVRKQYADFSLAVRRTDAEPAEVLDAPPLS